jgi:hypothetical protein
MTVHKGNETRQLPEDLGVTLPEKYLAPFWILYDGAGRDGWVPITQRELAFRTGVHVNSMFSYLWKLKALGLIENGYSKWRVTPTIAAMIASESHE